MSFKIDLIDKNMKTQRIDYYKLRSVMLALAQYLVRDGKPRSFENRLWRIRYFLHYHASEKPMNYDEWRHFMRSCGYNHRQIFMGYGHLIRWYRRVLGREQIIRTVDIAYWGLMLNPVDEREI